MTNFLKLAFVALIGGGIAGDLAIHHGKMHSYGISFTVVALALVAVLFVALLPALVASHRRHQHTLAIQVLSVVSFLITLQDIAIALQNKPVDGVMGVISTVGWIVALVWACTPVRAKRSRIRLAPPTDDYFDKYHRNGAAQ